MNIISTGKVLTAAATLGAAVILGGCVVAPPPQPQTHQYALTAAPTNKACQSCGVVTSVNLSSSVYSVSIHMDDGSTRTVHQRKQPAFQVGDRVQVLVRKP